MTTSAAAIACVARVDLLLGVLLQLAGDRVDEPFIRGHGGESPAGSASSLADNGVDGSLGSPVPG